MRQYEAIFPALAQSRIDQVSVERRNAHVPMHLLKLLEGKGCPGRRDRCREDEVETPEDVAAVISEAMKYVAKDKIVASTNCGMAPMRWDVAYGKLAALAAVPNWRGGHWVERRKPRHRGFGALSSQAGSCDLVRRSTPQCLIANGKGRR
jgi:hypothetical protein